MLLARDADAKDVLAIDIGRQQGATGGEGEGLQPLARVLLATAIDVADQRVSGGAQPQHLAADGIENDGFGALGAAVDAEE
ncbi:hypothetical protein D3C85_1772210 [compost metagenome]